MIVIAGDNVYVIAGYQCIESASVEMHSGKTNTGNENQASMNPDNV